MSGLLTALIIEPAEPLEPEERYIGVKTIIVEYENGFTQLGYIGVVKTKDDFGESSFRYVTLRAIPYTKKQFGQVM